MEEHGATGAAAGYLTHMSSDDEDVHSSVPTTSPVFVTLTLIMSVVGTGLLSLPATMKCIGVLPGVGTLALVALLMIFTGELMLRCHLASPSHCDSYEALTKRCFAVSQSPYLAGREKWATQIVNLVNSLGIFGGCCAYMAIAKNTLPKLKYRLRLDDSLWFWSDYFVTGVLVTCISFPLCLKKNIASLRFSSVFGFCFSIYMIAIISFRGFGDILNGDAKWAEIECAHRGEFTSLVIAISVFNFSFVFHFNIIPLYTSLHPESRNPKTMRRIIIFTVIFCAFIYAAVAVSGFALYGAATQDNILNNFETNDDVVNTARIAIVACCYLCLPLLEHPLRGSMSAFLGLGNSKFNRIMLTFVLLVSQYCVSILIPSIETIFSLTGGTAVVGFCYVFPVLFALALLSNRYQESSRGLLEVPILMSEMNLSSPEKCICIAILVCLPIVGMMSTASQIAGTVPP